MDIDRIDFYDHEKLDRLHKKRAKEWLKLFLEAKKGGESAKESIRKHEAVDNELRDRSGYTGYLWA